MSGFVPGLGSLPTTTTPFEAVNPIVGALEGTVLPGPVADFVLRPRSQEEQDRINADVFNRTGGEFGVEIPGFISFRNPEPGETGMPHDFLTTLLEGGIDIATSPIGLAIIQQQLGRAGGPAVPTVIVQPGLPGAPLVGPGVAGTPVFTGGLQLPGFDLPGVDFGLSGAPCIRANPTTGRFPSEVTFVDNAGKIRSYTNRGRPILWSRDRSTAARTNRLLGGRVTKSGVTRSRRSAAKKTAVCVVCNGGSNHE